MKSNTAKLKESTSAAKTIKKASRSKAGKPGEIKATVGVHNLRPPFGSHKRKKLLGRGPGSGHGKTSTRGSKGQTSRSGRDYYSGFEGGQTPLIRRMPKRGFTSKFRKVYQIVNIENLAKLKEALVNPQVLNEKGLIKDRSLPVKILGEGDIKNPMTVKAHAFSKQAAEKIKNAGGAIEVLND